jgi:DNA-binding MarR family transcriptional regulator
MSDDELLLVAAVVRQGVTRLGRRLRMERPDRGEPGIQLSVLSLLLRRGPMTPGQIAAVERVQPQSLTRTFASLEAEQFVTRATHPEDARRSVLAITEEGRRTLRRDVRQCDSWLARAMAEHLTDTERGLLRLAGGLLERLAEIDGAPGGVADGR